MKNNIKFCVRVTVLRDCGIGSAFIVSDKDVFTDKREVYFQFLIGKIQIKIGKQIID